MAESVKITELPAISSLVNDDIIVVVDENETQTSKATLGQVKNMDCGPNTVKETAIAQAAVTKQKVALSAANKIIYSGGVAVGDKVLGEETDLTQFARQLLGAGAGGTDQEQRDAFRSLLNESATFERIYVGDGDSSAPSISFTNDSQTGIFAGEAGLLGFAVSGNRFMTMLSTGDILTSQPRPASLAQGENYDIVHMLSLGLNSLCVFTPGAAVVEQFYDSGYSMATFFGMPSVIRGIGQYGQSDQANVIRVDGTFTTNANGTVNTYSGNLGAMAHWLSVHGYDLNTLQLTTGSFSLPFDNSVANVSFDGQVGSPLVRVSNTFANTQNSFYNTLRVRTRASSLAVQYLRGVSSVQNTNTQYTLNFGTHYPDNDYAILFGSTNNASISSVVRYNNKITFTLNANGSSHCWLATVR